MLILTLVKLSAQGQSEVLSIVLVQQVFYLIHTFLSCTEKQCTTSNCDEVKLTAQAAMVGASRAIIIQSAPASPHENLNRVPGNIHHVSGRVSADLVRAAALDPLPVAGVLPGALVSRPRRLRLVAALATLHPDGNTDF